MITKKALLAICFMSFSGVIIADSVAAPEEINLEKELAKMKAFNGDEAYQELFHAALAGGKEALARKILQEKRDAVDLSKRNKLGCSLLYAAMFQEDDVVNKKMVQLLLDEGFDPNTTEPKVLGGSSLHAAVFQGRIGAAEALIEAGAYVNGDNANGLVPNTEAIKWVKAPEYIEKVTPLQILFYDWRSDLGDKRVKMLQCLIVNDAFVGGVHDSYGLRILLCGAKEIRFSSELDTFKKMEDILVETIVENTIKLECPFSGSLR